MTITNQLKAMAKSKDSLVTPQVWSNTKYLSQLFDDCSPEFQFAVALATYELSRGNTCVNVAAVTGPRQWPNHPLNGLGVHIDDVLAYLEDKKGEWLQEHFVAPMRYHRGRLYIDRLFHFERSLSDSITTRINKGLVPNRDESKILDLSSRYFAFNDADDIDWQKAAAVMGLTRYLTVITGGPGTGKTTTVTRMLSMLFEDPSAFGFVEPPKVVLAAPTGKAKNRMAESIMAQVQVTEGPMALPSSNSVKARLNIEPQTIHRLLRVNPTKEEPHFNRYNKLDCDVCVIDEGSMIDLELICQLVDALPEHARLIILADKDQLASVDAGAVISELCTPIVPMDNMKRSIGVSGSTRKLVEAVTKKSVESFLRNDHIMLANHVISLQKSHRFNEQTGIGVLANSINNADVAGAKSAFNQFDDVEWIAEPSAEKAKVVARLHYIAYHTAIEANPEPTNAFAKLTEQIVLTSVKKGPLGALALNKSVVESRVEDPNPWYVGMPIMVTENAYQTGLFNGDIGVVLPDDDGQLKACFQSSDGGYRYLSRHRLPKWEVAYALTIHKSQGSEWKRVIVILSENPNIETKELLYTGLTRAKQDFQLLASNRALMSAIRRRSQRSSGLFEEVEYRCQKSQ